jgi:hypothetical protein
MELGNILLADMSSTEKQIAHILSHIRTFKKSTGMYNSITRGWEEGNGVVVS